MLEMFYNCRKIRQNSINFNLGSDSESGESDALNQRHWVGRFESDVLNRTYCIRLTESDALPRGGHSCCACSQVHGQVRAGRLMATVRRRTLCLDPSTGSGANRIMCAVPSVPATNGRTLISLSRLTCFLQRHLNRMLGIQAVDA